VNSKSNSSLKGRGCQEGNYTLRSITELRRTHNLGTWALFVDLRKAFDTADHDLLYKLLEIYGAPENIINLVQHLHDDFVLKLRIGDETHEIPYGKGVKQGNVMAPILFLFLMLAFLETLEEEYKEWGIKPIEFKYHTDITKGQLKSQTLQCRALTFHIAQLLSVDDTFFPFATRDDLIQGTNQNFHLYRCFGLLLMHIGKGETVSKSKAMYFPPSLPKKTSEPTNESTIATTTDRTSSHNSPTNSSTTVSNTTPTPTDSDSNSDPLYTLPAHMMLLMASSRLQTPFST
jgi:hypothetical protein